MSGKLPRCCWLLSASLLVASIAVAQPYSVGYVPGGYRRPYYGYGGYGYGGYGGYGGGTAAGGYLNGMASAIRAEGQYNLLSSQAAINLEEAKKKEIENRTHWTNAYFEMRRINDAYTHPKKDPTPPETWVRLAHDALPQRLPGADLDPVTGRIAWPDALQGDPFAADREKLEALFAERAIEHGAIGVDAHGRIRRAVDDALAKLKDHIREIDSRSYVEARNFLTSLSYEASLPGSG
jgi:hypothetical protein